MIASNPLDAVLDHRLLEDVEELDEAVATKVDSIPAFKDANELEEQSTDMPLDFKGPAQLLAWFTCGPVGENAPSLALRTPTISFDGALDIDKGKRQLTSELEERALSPPKCLRLLEKGNQFGRLIGSVGADPQP